MRTHGALVGVPLLCVFSRLTSLSLSLSRKTRSCFLRANRCISTTSERARKGTALCVCVWRRGWAQKTGGSCVAFSKKLCSLGVSLLGCVTLWAPVGAILPAKIARASVGRVVCARGHGRVTRCVGAWHGRERERASENLCFGGQSCRARNDNGEKITQTDSRDNVFAAPPCHRCDFARSRDGYAAPGRFSLGPQTLSWVFVEFTNSVDVTLVWRNYLCDSPRPLRASAGIEQARRSIFFRCFETP